MTYKPLTMNIKHLTEFLLAYVSAIESNKREEIERLMQEISLIFNRLHTVTSDESDKEEIINIILLKMQEKTLTHFDVATYVLDLVFLGYS